MAFSALRLEHLPEFIERSVYPLQKRVEELASTPEKLQTIRSGFENLGLQEAVSDGDK
jgi:hypothetical protein